MERQIQKIKRDEYNGSECVILPPVDIYEEEESFVLAADMPGVSKENLSITLENGKLEIHGKAADESEDERLKYSEFTLKDFHRTFIVNENINPDGISAKLENGVLTVSLPKSERVRPRKIEIQRA